MCKRTCALVSLALIFGLGACSKAPPALKRPPPEVTVVTVEAKTIPVTQSFVAQTESSRQVNIVARVSGYLDKIAYQEGEFVKEGQLLFQIDPRPFKAQVDAATGELLAQQARFKTATATLKRVKPLTAQNALSQSDLDRAQGEYDASRAAVFATGAKLTEAKLNLGYTTIRSPVTGLASQSLQREGAYLSATGESALLTYVAKVDPVWVNFSVSQNQIAKSRNEVKQGRLLPPKNQEYRVELVLSDGALYPEEGKISFADPSFSPDTGSFLVRAVLPNPKKDLRPGMFVTANVKGMTRPDAIVVPQRSVQQGSNGHLVYVVKKDGTAEIRPVVVGDYFGMKDIVIVSGLHAGDRVVADGVLKVVPGKPVKIVEPDQAAGAKKAGAPAKPKQ